MGEHGLKPMEPMRAAALARRLRHAARCAAVAACCAHSLFSQSAVPVEARHAMVVSVQHDASDAGLEILKKGGNAVDAAVATGFALAVVYPYAGNLGGGGFMLLRLANGDAHFLDFREKAPLRATANMYLDERGNVIPEASTVGYASIGVPGTVAGLVEAERKYGKLKLKQVMEPAIRLAEQGYTLSGEEADLLRDPLLARFPDSRRIFQRNGDSYRENELFRQPELARTLRSIERHPNSFYRGAIAKELARALAEHGALITTKDLAAYRVEERPPLIGTYRGYEIVAPPPPSSGGVTLLETLNILEGYDLGSLGDRSPQEMHLIAEAFRRAFMDRNAFLGDPDFASIPTAQLISKERAIAWRAGIDPSRATPSDRLSAPPGPVAASSPGLVASGPGSLVGPEPYESTETTHYSVLDQDGNAVAVTYTLNNGFGSGVTAGRLGFLLNDEMDDFTIKAGTPNMFGLIQGAANAIAPGKRPLSSMTPVIVLKDGKVRLIAGSPGGPRIITTVANILISSIDGGLNIQQAVDAPRFHHQYLPDKLYLEPGFPESTIQSLVAMGYAVQIGPGPNGRAVWSDGECIAVDPKSGRIEGGQDQRHHFGKAAGY